MISGSSLLTTFLTLLISLTVTAIFNFVLNGTKKARKKIETERVEKIRQIIKEETADKFSESIENDMQIKTGLQFILKNLLKAGYDKCFAEGYAPSDARDDLEKLYQVYHTLGANGVMDADRSRFLALPTRPPKRS